MRTLTSHISSNYLKTGAKPRVLVDIPGMGLQFKTSLKEPGSLRKSIKPFGGLESISSLTFSNLQLGEDVKFATETTVRRKSEGRLSGSGRVIQYGSDGGPYATVRNMTFGSYGEPAIIVGQKYGNYIYGVYRGFVQFAIPSDLTACNEATLYLEGIATYLNRNIQIIAVLGNWSSLGTGGVGDNGLYNDFEGWQSSGSYLGHVTQLTDVWSSTEYVTYDATKEDNEAYNMLRFNATGLSTIESLAGSTLKIMLISVFDAIEMAPTGDEFISFSASSVMLKLRYNEIDPNGETVNVYRYYDPEPASTSDMLQVYSGIINHHTINDRLLSMEITRDDIKSDSVIPTDTIENSEFPYCPETNIGRAKPLVYGDFIPTEYQHRSGVGYYLGGIHDFRDTQFGFSTDRIKGIVIKEAKIDGHNYALVLLSMRNMKNHAGWYSGWNSENKAYSYYPATVGTEIQFDDDIVKRLSPPDKNYFPSNMIVADYAEILSIIPLKVETGTGITDNPFPGGDTLSSPGSAENAIDSDTDNYTTFTKLYSVDGYTDIAAYYFDSSKAFTAGGYIAITGEVNYVSGASDNDLGILIQFTDDNGLTWQPDMSYGTGGGQIHGYLAEGDINWRLPVSDIQALYQISSLSQLRFIIYRRAKAGGGSCRVKNIGLLVTSPLEPKELFTTAQGLPDDISGTVTGTPSALIENPSHVIESLCRTELRMSASKINTSLFDTAAIDLPDWKFAFQLLNQQSAFDLLNRLGVQSKLSLSWDYANKIAAKAWDATEGFSVSGTDIPDELDIFAESGRTVTANGVDSYTRHPIDDLSLTLTPVSFDQVKNSFTLKYKMNYATGQCEEVITMDNGLGTAGNVSTTLVAGDEAYMESGQTIAGLSALTSANYTAMGSITSAMVYEAEFIRDHATAVKLFQHIIEAYTKRRYICELKTGDNAIRHENADIINIRHYRVYERFGVATSDRKKWCIIEINYALGPGKITIKAIEV